MRGRLPTLACAVAWLAAAPVSGADETVWLEVERPENGWVELGTAPLVEVRGAAGSRGRGILDVVVVIDASRSTKAGSGVDVNGDGYVGGVGWRHRRSWRGYLAHPQTSSDPGDSILHAEVEAVRQLVATLDPARSRVGVVSFTDTAYIRSSIGNTEPQLLRALGFLESEAPEGRTNMAEALRTAGQTLREARASAGPYRDLAIVLLSDGRPTSPAPEALATARAIDAARDVREMGVRIYTIALGVPDEDSRALREIASVGRGTYTALAEPGDIIVALPYLDLRGLADIRVENRTTGKKARAMRVWGDGSFDAFVELREGKNLLRITARGAEGSRVTKERYVYFRKRTPGDARERRLERIKLERLRDLLRERSLEVHLAEEVEAGRDGARQKSHRELSVAPERD